MLNEAKYPYSPLSFISFTLVKKKVEILFLNQVVFFV